MVRAKVLAGGNIIAIAGMCLSAVVVANDISAMNVALPSIERDLLDIYF